MWKGRAVTAGIAALGLCILAAGAAQAKVEGDTVYLGAAVSLTGKYTTAGEHTRRGLRSRCQDDQRCRRHHGRRRDVPS